MEIWRDIKDYEGLYRINIDGEIHSLINNIIKKQSTNHKGYKCIYLCKGGKRKKFYIHRLVASHFMDDCDKQINHIDGNKTNNNVDNLEWVTPRENMLHAYKSGLHKRYVGKENPNATAVCQYTMSGKLIKFWDSMADAAREVGGKSGNISACCIGKDNRGKNILSYKGYKWKYKGGDA